ncbi:MAG: NAD(P)/FAD-dependent oxidoreductase [Myxococcota bacterium]
MGRQRFDVVVVGAGQAGLAAARELRRAGLGFVVLERSARVGDVWRRRWDGLRLFTPARYDALAGLPFPGDPDRFPTKDEMADYLEAYVERFALPVRTGVTVSRVARVGDGYRVETDDGELEADQVIVAAASYQAPFVPHVSADLDAGIVQLHASEYRRPDALPEGPVLVVGAGNSGAEIALAVARTGRTVWLSGRDVGALPFHLDRPGGRLGAWLVLRLLFHRLLTVGTPLGRRVRPTVLSRGGPLIRARRADLAAAGVEMVPRVDGAADGRPRLADGRVLAPATVLWCTGYRPGLTDWLRVPGALDAHGEPLQDRGVSVVPGLGFVGLHFQRALSSAMIHGASRDAAHVVRVLARRALTATGPRPAPGAPARALAPR